MHGLYVCEDLHTSYWNQYGSGLYKRNSFIEFSKKFIDNLHAWYMSKQNQRKAFNKITTSVRGLHFYDSMLVIEKESILKPEVINKGKDSLEHHFTDVGQKKNLIKKIKSWLKSKH